MSGAKSFSEVSKEMITQIEAHTEKQNELTEDLKEIDTLSTPEQEQLLKEVDAATLVTTPHNTEYSQDVVSGQFDFMSLLFVGISIIAAIVVMSILRKMKASRRASKRRTEELVLANKDAFLKETNSIHSDAVTEQLKLEIALQEQKIKDLEKGFSNK